VERSEQSCLSSIHSMPSMIYFGQQLHFKMIACIEAQIMHANSLHKERERAEANT
jgi:hypothetical protein